MIVAALRRARRSAFGAKAPFDLFTFTAIGLTVEAVAAVASYCPAWRATRVDPAVALRME